MKTQALLQEASMDNLHNFNLQPLGTVCLRFRNEITISGGGLNQMFFLFLTTNCCAQSISRHSLITVLYSSLIWENALSCVPSYLKPVVNPIHKSMFIFFFTFYMKRFIQLQQTFTISQTVDIRSQNHARAVMCNIQDTNLSHR